LYVSCLVVCSMTCVGLHKYMEISFRGDWQVATPNFSTGQKLNFLSLNTKPVSNLD
jgi:hypothetical protein